MIYKRGDVVLAYFPFTDLKQVKKRPALVVQANNLTTGLSDLMLAYITSTMSRGGQPHRVVILLGDKKYVQANFLLDSVVVADHVVTLDTSLIYKKIGKIVDMSAIDQALRVAFAL